MLLTYSQTGDMCMNNSSLFRKLKAIIGKKLSEYLRIKRLEKAAELLQCTEYSIMDGSPPVVFRPTDFREREGKGGA